MNQARVESILRMAAPVAAIAGGIVALCAVLYAAFAVGHLFSAVVKISPIESGLAVVSSVGMAVALLLTIVTSQNPNARGMGAILVIAWLLLTLALVALDSVLRADIVTAPDALLVIGRIVAALLPALALAGVACMVVALHDTSPQKSAAGAAGKYVGFTAKGVAVGASVFASFYFGVSRGIDPFLAVLCGLLLESSFLWSYLALKNARDRRDRFDVGMWSVCVLAFGAFIAAVSVETVSTLGKIEVPIVSALGEIGATLYVSAVGLALILTVAVHLLTRAIDLPAQAGAAVTVRRPAPLGSRIAGSIIAARSGAGAVRDALTMPQPAQISPPSSSQMAAADRDRVTVQTVTEQVRPAKDRSEKARRCKWCKTAFTATDGRAQYCSPKCRKAASRAVDSSHSHDED